MRDIADGFEGQKTILEGWFVGRMEDGYDSISRFVSFLIYLDCPITLSKRRRFQREENLRRGGVESNVLSSTELNRFWTEVLEPGVTLWVRPLRDKADLIVTFDDQGTLQGARLK
jgi:hypothetical protein